MATRSRRLTEDRKATRRQMRQMQRKLVAALQHIFSLESDRAQRGLPVPNRPAILEMDDEDDEPAPAARPPAASDAP